MKAWKCLVFLFVTVVAKNEEYKGWASYYVLPYNYEELEVFNILVEKYDLDVYSHPYVKREGLVLVDPLTQKKFTDSMDELRIRYRTHTKNLNTHLDLEEKYFKENIIESPTRIGGKLPYNQYQTVDTIYKYMDDIAAEYPNVAKVVTKESFNGKPLKYMKVSTTNFADTRKPIIFLDGGIHGREWMSIPPVTYAINKLVENVTDRDILNRFDWILLPIVNPDGYNHSRIVSAAFRKTRSTTSDPWSRLCPGVDVDRNFDIVWNTVGVSDNRCSYVFPGDKPFSEVEAAVVRDILHENKRILMYISFSSFGSLIMYPWAFDASLSDLAFLQHTVGVRMAETINAMKLPQFHNYRVGNAGLIRMRGMSGTSIDYAHQVGVPLTYTIELPGLFGGYFMNPIYIEQVVTETWEGIKAGARRALQLN